MASKKKENTEVTTDIEQVSSTPAPVSAAIVDEYRQHGYKAEDAAVLEEVAGNIRNLKRATAEYIVEVGRYFNDVRERFAYGNWQFYVENRCATSIDTAQRTMAAAKAVEAYPQLAERIENIQAGALYVMGQKLGKGLLTQEHVDNIMAYADEEITPDNVREIVNGTQEPKEAKKQSLGFTPMDSTRGTQAAADLVNVCDRIFGSVARAGLDPNKTARNRDFKYFARRVSTGRELDTELEKALHQLLLAAFVFYVSAEELA
jgi:hypothetical protein